MQKVDLIALDRDERPYLLVEAQRRPVSPGQERELLHELAESREGLPYGRFIGHGIIADPVSIRLYELESTGTSPLVHWDTGQIIGHYSPEILDALRSDRGVPSDSIAGLIGSWIRDIAYQWKSSSPPGVEEWKSVGLWPRLQDGTTLSEVPLGFDALR